VLDKISEISCFRKQESEYSFAIDLAIGKLEIFADWVSGENELDYDFFINKTDYHDGGRFMGTADMVITRDPQSGWVNVGTYRVQLHDANTLGLYITQPAGRMKGMPPLGTTMTERPSSAFFLGSISVITGFALSTV